MIDGGSKPDVYCARNELPGLKLLIVRGREAICGQRKKTHRLL